MRILPQNCTAVARPNVYLCGTAPSYVEEFKNIGHFITVEFSDTKAIQRDVRSLFSRGIMLIRKFNFCSVEVKCFLFRAFRHSLYTSSLWARFRVGDLKRLEVCYNTIFRILDGLNRWESPHQHLFICLAVRRFF